MTRTLSPRAQEILAALEREPLAHRPDALPGEQPSATPPQAAEPAEDHEPAADLPARVDAALAQTEMARRRLSTLAEAVEEFAARRGVADGGSRPEPEPPVRVVSATSPADATAQTGERRLSGRAARRLAVEMAAAGASRDAVGDRLRSLHGITEPGPTLDLVFGAGTSDEGRSGVRQDTAPDPPPVPSMEGTDPRAILDKSPVSVIPAVPPEVRSESAAPAPTDERRPSSGSPLRLAVDLAAAGESRGSVGDWLRSLYGIPDPTSTLDFVFGVGTTGKDRIVLRRENASDRSGAVQPSEALLATRPVTARSSAVRQPPAAGGHEAGASPVEPPLSFEVIDLHHHLLPGIDDGPPTLDDALTLARAAVAAGTTTVVATPHVTSSHPGNTAASIADGVAALQDALAEANIPLRVLPGAEVAVTHAVDLSEEELTALRLGAGPYLLIECPLATTGASFELLLESLLERDHRILLAHPERCHTFQHDTELLARLVSRGVLSQITASSLAGDFGRTVREVAHGLVRKGLVHVVASDAHSVAWRPPSLLAEVEQEGYAEQAAWLVSRTPRAILEGGPLPRMPAVPPLPRSGLKRLLGR